MTVLDIRPAQRPLELELQVAAAPDLPPPGRGLRSLLTRQRFMHHNRLVAIVVIANAVVLVNGALSGWWSATANIDSISTMVLINLALAVLIRQQCVVNALFWVATRAPTSWPLGFRALLGKVYHFGGLHVGGAVCATVWFLVLAGSMAYEVILDTSTISAAVLGLTALILALLVGMILLALPARRARAHDRFERMHRFGGWTVLGLFWVHSYLLAAGSGSATTGDATILASPNFWVLSLVTASIALPWLRLRRVAVDIETPSSHVAIARFDYGVTPFAGSSTAISRNPLVEWHHFANVPAPDQHGFRLTISRSGDWTAALIDDRPTHVWVKGIPTAGVGNIDRLFKRVIWVATGSGIGPCLPHLLAQDTPSHLVWSTRSPRETYGDALVDEILAVQPNALIWDTSRDGKPDLIRLAYQAYQEFEAEAVICISNKTTTWQIVEGMEIRGVPAYGAIWDS